MNEDKNNQTPDKPSNDRRTNHLGFSRDMIMRSIKDYSDDQKSAILWLFTVAKKSDWKLTDIEAAVGYSTTTWHKLFKGSFEGNVNNVCKAIKSYRRLHEEREAAVAPDFIKTSLTKRIWDACDYSLITQSVVFLWGENQIGKTEALEEYQRTHNHGQTILVRLPANCSTLLVAKEIAKEIGLTANGTFGLIRERIFDSLDHKNTLICDEMHQALLTNGKGGSIKVLEFIREIHDRTKCGLVLCGTNVWRDGVNKGEHRKMLGQLRNRGIAHIQLEDRPKKIDLRKFWKFYGLDDPEGKALSIVNDLVAEFGLGKFVKFLQAGARLAAKREETPSWQHFITAFQTLARFSK